MRIISFIIGLGSLLLAACGGPDRKKVEIVELGPGDKTIHSFSDSSFFSDISCIETDGTGSIYVLDRKRSQIIRLDEDMRLLSVIGHQGRGPQEIGAAISFSVRNDTVYVGDAYKRGVLMFTPSGEWCGMIDMKEAFPYFKRFSVRDEGSICFAACSGQERTSLAEYDRPSAAMTRFGQWTDFGTPAKNDMQNKRSVFFRDGQYIAVPWSIPVVEFYDAATLRPTETLDLSEVTPVKEIYLEMTANREIRESPNMWYVFMEDTYLNRDKLYVLLNPDEGTADEFKTGSVVLEIDLSGPERFVSRKFSLPGEHLSRIGVTNNRLYGFSPDDASLRRYPLPE